MWRRKLFGLLVVSGIALIALVGDFGTAFASAPIVSPDDPYNSCNFGGFDSQTVAADSELEPRVAVDPANSSDAIAAFQHDRWSAGGAEGVPGSNSGERGGHGGGAEPQTPPSLSQISEGKSG